MEETARRERADRLLAILRECKTGTDLWETWACVIETLPWLANHGYPLHEDLQAALGKYDSWKSQYDGHTAGKWLKESVEEALEAYSARLVDARDRTLVWLPKAKAEPVGFSVRNNSGDANPSMRLPDGPFVLGPTSTYVRAAGDADPVATDADTPLVGWHRVGEGWGEGIYERRGDGLRVACPDGNWTVAYGAAAPQSLGIQGGPALLAVLAVEALWPNRALAVAMAMGGTS